MYSLESPSNLTLPVKTVPSGTLSDIFTVPVASPVFVDVNVYVIVSLPVTFIVFPAILLAFTVLIIAIFVSTSFVSLSFTIAVFNTDPSTSLLTFTSKLNSTFLPGSTFTPIPTVSKFSYVNATFGLLFIFILPGTNVVPSGALSFIVTIPSILPLFVASIVYVSISPTFASSLLTFFIDVITGA